MQNAYPHRARCALITSTFLAVLLPYLVTMVFRALDSTLPRDFGSQDETFFRLNYIQLHPISFAELVAGEEAAEALLKANNTLIFTHNQFKCLRCQLFIRNTWRRMRQNRHLASSGLSVVSLDVSRPNAPNAVLKTSRNQVFFAINNQFFEIGECQGYLRMRPEVPLFIDLFLDCLRTETEVILRRIPHPLHRLEDLLDLMQVEPIILLHIGSDLFVRTLISRLDPLATKPLRFVTDWKLADQIGLKFKGGGFRGEDKLCVLKADHLIDSHDPYQMPCTKVNPKADFNEVVNFYIREKSKSVMAAPTPVEILEHLRMGKSCVFYVKSKIFESDKFRQWLKLLVSEDRSATCYAYFNSTSQGLRDLAWHLNLTSYRFSPENIYMIFPGNEHGFEAVRMRGELNRWDFRRFVESKKSDLDYDMIEKMEAENQEAAVRLGSLGFMAVLWVGILAV